MNLTIACSYCRRQLILKLTAPIVVNGRSATIGPPVKCEACGSTTTIEINTLRKSKGKGMKEIEVRAKAKLDAAIDATRARNAEIGARLLLEPGCTCQAQHNSFAAQPWHNSMTHGGRDGGHFLSTGWSQDKAAGGMLPTEPEHYHTCPVRKRHTAAVNNEHAHDHS